MLPLINHFFCFHCFVKWLYEPVADCIAETLWHPSESDHTKASVCYTKPKWLHPNILYVAACVNFQQLTYAIRFPSSGNCSDSLSKNSNWTLNSTRWLDFETNYKFLFSCPSCFFKMHVHMFDVGCGHHNPYHC